jgi:hypothetical protein
MSFTVRFGDGDIEIGSTGEQSLISGAEKAAQDLLDEILLPYDGRRDRGNEMFEVNGQLTSIVGAPSVGASAIRTFIKSAVKRLQRAQRFESGTSRSELIERIKTLVVQPMNNDVTSYGFLLAVVVDDENIAIARAISMGHLGNTPTPLVGGYDP